MFFLNYLCNGFVQNYLLGNYISDQILNINLVNKHEHVHDPDFTAISDKSFFVDTLILSTLFTKFISNGRFTFLGGEANVLGRDHTAIFSTVW